METALRESLKKYFVLLAKTDAKWKEFLTNVERPLKALRNQSEQLQHVVSNEVDDAEICRMDGVRHKLIYKIVVGIENEISMILNELQLMRNPIQDLKFKLKNLEAVRSDTSVRGPSFQELANGTCLRPQLDLLMKWAVESSRYYSDLCDAIYANFQTLDYKSEKSINSCITSFKQTRRGQAYIEKILASTQFLVKETIR